ncbi:hypothetical protein PFDG_05476 [Plasmodium falciparum Dd2]|uniref:Uncharacterized protein n=1 Tax=Plasmodium falciparum (isolate Dd2) TaxID=57267 RepID=A0A0L7M1E1_PLAF4|nr:hypothetical protein PFDG_05476 [Plasmodium falciparum Dd2]
MEQIEEFLLEGV